LDVKTSEVIWDVHIPRGKQFQDLLNVRAEISSSNTDTKFVPKLFFDSSNESTVSVVKSASVEEFRGAPEQFPELPITKNIVPSDGQVDERLIVPLPWNERHQIQGFSAKVLSIFTEELPIAFGAVVFPFIFLRFLFKRKQWSLQLFLLVPLVFVFPYLALGIPSKAGESISQLFGMPLFAGKLWTTSFTIPTMFFFLIWIRSFWRQEWRVFFLASLIAILLSVLYGATQFFGRPTEMPGSHYDWYDPESFWLLLTGCWVVGTFAIFQWIFFGVGRFAGSLYEMFVNRKLSVTS
jgi:hypothetical protein